ncbi:hypothetical protein [Propionimicrobium lymphophilum]|uniref:hypothetical protein n=1 Tax=Propionimicrobium lymphophilum TaxID=33012 RepID=UPI0023F08A98|nr:hypothetical protein [Propionimicrobium lymphophilum]
MLDDAMQLLDNTVYNTTEFEQRYQQQEQEHQNISDQITDLAARQSKPLQPATI